MQSPIANGFIKFSIGGHSEPQLVPKNLPQVSFWETNNSMVSHPEEGGLKEVRDADNIIIISDSMLRSIISPQLNNISACYKFMCGCECCISDKIIHSS